MKITHFTVLGERCSGTNYLEQLMTHNFNIKYTHQYGHKHFFCFNTYNNSDHVLFIGIVRNPVYWINSFSKELYHVPPVNHNVITFLFNEFYSIHDEYSISPNKHLCITSDYKLNKYTLNKQDLNYKTNGKYENIFELRKVKNEYLMDVMPNKVKYYTLINYEDLLYNMNEIMDKIQQTFLLEKKFPFYKNIKNYKRSNNHIFHATRQITMASFIVNIIWKKLDEEQEKKLGYFKGNNNELFKQKSRFSNKI